MVFNANAYFVSSQMTERDNKESFFAWFVSDDNKPYRFKVRNRDVYKRLEDLPVGSMCSLNLTFYEYKFENSPVRYGFVIEDLEVA